MKRIILHLDMDYFFAQVEERENPRFKGKPVVVGADPKGGGGRGVVSTCNYLAREYGIHSAMPISKAFELCPDAIFLPVEMELYQQVSERIMEIIKKYSPKLIAGSPNLRAKGANWGFEQVSLDEAYLDLSYIFYDRRKCSIGKMWEKAKEIAQKLKKEIFKKEKLTATIGVGSNKLIAKMACERAKPDGLLTIKPARVKEFLNPLDIEKLPGIGPKTAEKLRVLKINKIEELKKLSKSKLKNMFGVVGETIYEKARGIDKEPVSPEEIVKSIGREHTFEKDTRDSKIIFETFDEIIEDVYQKLFENNFKFKIITVVCRFSGFETHTKSKTLKNPTQDLEILKKEAKKLLLKFLMENLKLIRLVGLRIKVKE